MILSSESCTVRTFSYLKWETLCFRYVLADSDSGGGGNGDVAVVIWRANKVSLK